MIRVLIVEDSATIRELLVHLVNSDSGMTVAGTASDGEQAIAAVDELRPDLITMDIVMPKMDGLAATRKIMQTRPTPIVIVSSLAPTAEAEASFQALEAGALAVVPRPAWSGAGQVPTGGQLLLRTIRLMSEIKVVRRWSRASLVLPGPKTGSWKASVPLQAVAVGGSTGAPAVLEKILAALPRDFPLPILIVQHMAVGFMHSFAQWLGHRCALRVAVASESKPLENGVAYLAPDDAHLGVRQPARLYLDRSAPEHGLRPSVSFLFRSMADVFGAGCAAVLLSGMGNDGAEAMLRLRSLGALTIVQDRESSVVHGMPGEAIALGAAASVLNPGQIAATLLALPAAQQTSAQ